MAEAESGAAGATELPAEMVETVARALYRCERERANHAERIMALAGRREPKPEAMEPWEEVADLYRGDARAALAALHAAGGSDD